MSDVTSDSFEALFAEAEADLKRQEIPDEWGPLRQTEEGDRILARYLGRDTLPPFDDTVFRFVDYPGDPTPFYLRRTVQLEQALDNADVGDVVGLVRGRDKVIAGREHAMQSWAGWARECDEPLTGAAASASHGGDGIPF
jgi:hypothetical protein